MNNYTFVIINCFYLIFQSISNYCFYIFIVIKMIIYNFKIKKCRKGFKITFLNWFNDYVFVKNTNELNKLYKISNEYNIRLAKNDIMFYMQNPKFFN